MKTIALLTALLLMTASAFSADSIYNISVKNIDGKDTSLKAYQGKVLLVVNVASKCGNTPQYKSLESIYEKYKAKDFTVLGFPCNQFGGQEPGSSEQIKEFCTSKAMDLGAEFEKLYPESRDLPQVRSKLTTSLGNLFGFQGIQVPPERAPDVEGCIRKLLVGNKGDYGLNMALLHVAISLPMPKQLAICQELSGESIMVPVRDKARIRLRDLKRLGKPLELSFTALDGRKVDMKELKNKVVIIDFWATTCAPCIVLLPSLKELYSKYQAQGLEVIGVSLDTDRDKLTQFIKKNEIPWPQSFDAAGDDGPVPKAFAIKGIPVVWLVDRQGLLRHLDARMGLEEKVDSLLKEQK